MAIDREGLAQALITWAQHDPQHCGIFLDQDGDVRVLYGASGAHLTPELRHLGYVAALDPEDLNESADTVARWKAGDEHAARMAVETWADEKDAERPAKVAALTYEDSNDLGQYGVDLVTIDADGLDDSWAWHHAPIADTASWGTEEADALLAGLGYRRTHDWTFAEALAGRGKDGWTTSVEKL